MNTLSRRTLLKSAAIATTASALRLPAPAEPVTPPPYPENGTLIPDDGWHLWIDNKAAWAEDDIFLPEDITIAPDGTVLAQGHPLPINAPTGGWHILTPTAGKEVMLPSTVEQHFWGKFGSRPYTSEEYRYGPPATPQPPVPPADDNVPQNGAYFGVSWWHRAIPIPPEMRGKRIFLHIRGAHLRAEVYLNRKLVGYSIMEELPFECDLTHAANPGGENTLAIRITNPFGRYDWVDGLNAKWHNVSLYRSHGFGGLDRGMTISAQTPGIRVKDAWVLNTPDPRTVRVSLKIEAPSANQLVDLEAIFAASVYDKSGQDKSGQEVRPGFGGRTHVPNYGLGDIEQARSNFVKALGIAQENGRFTRVLDGEVIFPDAKLWQLNTPQLYDMRVTLQVGDITDTRTIQFGFRTFGPEGIGTNALFRLNGKRIRIYSSISWGFWGLNGMFPVPELAEKEVTQAKKLGLNCLNFHRNLAKEDVLRAHDRLGLLRYLEPGAGKLAIGKLPANVQANAAGIVMEKPTSEADKFAQRYMFVKCVEMVKAYRSHPSVIEYCLQNEIGADLNNPATIAILEAMRAEDPSRCIVLNDGFVAPPRKAAQAWFEPWNPKLHRSDTEPWGGWWNQHQGAGDQWYDEFYKSPTDFTYKSPEHAALSEFGEMEGCATPDNHALMIHQVTDTYKKYGGTSYDLVDHQQIDAATNRWLDRWNFRKAFPSTETLYNALGKKCYDTWQNYLENARISDDLDFAVISGWESTSIENHSGIVDNLRNFKSDPAPIAQTLQPIHPVAKQRSTVVAWGDDAIFDLYLLNDTSTSVTGELVFSVVESKGAVTEIARYPVPKQEPDVFSYLVKESVTWRPKQNKTVPYGYEGRYRFRFELTSLPLSTQTKDIWITYKDLKETVGLKIGVSGISAALRKQLQSVVEIADFKPGEKYDVIISSGLTSHITGEVAEAGETTGLEAVPPPMKPGHKPEPGEEPITQQLGHLQKGILEAVSAGTPLLAIPQANSLSDGVAQQLAAAGAFTFSGNVGDFRAPWMGNWYFVREHPLFEGLPVNQAMGLFYQTKGRQSNGLLIDQTPGGPPVEIVVGYSRDHDRKLGAGTFTTSLGKGKIVYHRCPDFHPVLQQRFLANALRYLTS